MNSAARMTDLENRLRAADKNVQKLTTNVETLRKNRAAGRKDWLAEQKRSNELQVQVKNLKNQLSDLTAGKIIAPAKPQSNGPKFYTGNYRVVADGEEAELDSNRLGVDDSMDLLRLENKKLRSHSMFLQDLVKENAGLREDRLAKSETVKRMLEESKGCDGSCESNLKIESAALDRANDAKASLQREFQRCQRENTDLRVKLEGKRDEIEKMRRESEVHQGSKRKLTAFLKDMGITKDDLTEDREAARPAKRIVRTNISVAAPKTSSKSTTETPTTANTPPNPDISSTVVPKSKIPAHNNLKDGVVPVARNYRLGRTASSSRYLTKNAGQTRDGLNRKVIADDRDDAETADSDYDPMR